MEVETWEAESDNGSTTDLRCDVTRSLLNVMPEDKSKLKAKSSDNVTRKVTFVGTSTFDVDCFRSRTPDEYEFKSSRQRLCDVVSGHGKAHGCNFE